MIGPEEVRTKARRRFKDLCRTWLLGENPYPLTLPVSLSPKGISENQLFDSWTRLYEGSKVRRGFGYLVEFEERRTRNRGIQNIARRILIPSREDHLKLIGKVKEFDMFRRDVESLRYLFPGGDTDWFTSSISLLLRYAAQWKDIADYVVYLSDHPNLDYSPRDVPVADSKFYEHHRPAVKALATEVAGSPMAEALARWERPSAWQPTLRFLDPATRPSGFSRISVDLDQLEQFSQSPRSVLIVENLVSFDNLPENPGTRGVLAIWGEGNAVLALKKIFWLKTSTILYWGDMDREGLAILGRLRKSFPQVRSLAMSLKDFRIFEQYAVDDTATASPNPAYLDSGERELLTLLESRSKANRVEQERIPMDYVMKIITSAPV